jgi:hypothetical protein
VKAAKQNIISDLLIELEKGTERGKALAKIGKKWQLSDRTFDRHWKEAQEQYKIRSQEIQNELLKQSTEAEKERLREAILSKNETMEILTKLIQSEAEKTADRIAAVKTMADLNGWNAPSKQETTITDNRPPSTVTMPDGTKIEI